MIALPYEQREEICKIFFSPPIYFLYSDQNLQVGYAQALAYKTNT